MFDALRETGLVRYASERNEPVVMPLGGTRFSVAFDSLDSSSSVDVNFAVGASWSIWDGDQLTNRTGRDIVAAGLTTFGPRTSMLVATREEEGVSEYVLRGESWLHSGNVFMAMGEDDPVGRRARFAPGNLRAAAHNAAYERYVTSCINRGLTLRYSGGFVPDVSQLIIYGCGVFASPHGTDVEGTRARLSILYEGAPAAFVMERAGGASSNGETSILDVVIECPMQRSPICLGSPAEVEMYKAAMAGVR